MSNANIRALFDDKVQQLILVIDHSSGYPCHEIYTLNGSENQTAEEVVSGISKEGKKAKVFDLDNLPNEGLAKSLGGDFLVRVSADFYEHGFFRLFYVIKDAEKLAEFLEHPPGKDSYGMYTIQAVIDGRDPANQKVITDMDSLSVKKEVVGL